MSNNAHELSYRLLNALDKEYNVIDMHAVNEIISILEKFNITKELLETTRLGKYVNELRRKTTDPTLARRAKVLVKRWRDLVMPAVASPAHALGSNRSSVERTHRRFGGTPLTSPALSMHAVSPAVPSPRLPTRPAWGGYESDSQDVILVDDDPPPPAPPPAPAPALAAHKPTTPPVKRPLSPEPVLQDEKKAKRDKKPKKKRLGPSRTGSDSGADASLADPQWAARNGSAPERRRNGWRRDDAYAALVQRLPPAGAKKVKTTKELLEQIQSRAAPPSRAVSPASPLDPGSPDVMVVEDVVPAKSPLRNGTDVAAVEPKAKEEPVEPWEPLEDEREWAECTCGDDEDAACPAAVRAPVRPRHVRALHHALLPGVNGTRAPALPQQFAVRAAADADRPGLFASVVPLYKYSDYADDYCAKNMARVPICAHLPWAEFAPAPPSPPPPPDPPELRPYPWPDEEPPAAPPLDPNDVPTRSPSPEPEAEPEPTPVERPIVKVEYPTSVEAEAIGLPVLEPSERLKAPLLSAEEAAQYGGEPAPAAPAVKSFVRQSPEHRTVERTKAEPGLDGRTLYGLCTAALDAATWRYPQAAPAPVLGAAALQDEAALEGALDAPYADGRDALDRPPRAERFAEWHEPARLGDLVALPYVVLD